MQSRCQHNHQIHSSTKLPTNGIFWCIIFLSQETWFRYRFHHNGNIPRHQPGIWMSNQPAHMGLTQNSKGDNKHVVSRNYGISHNPWSAFMASLVLELEHDPRENWKKPERTLPKLEPVITVPPLILENNVAITDCNNQDGSSQLFWVSGSINN